MTVKKTIAKKLARYRVLLEGEGIPVSRMILFGSHAHGRPRPESDIDVCIISPCLGRDRIEEGKRLYLLAYRIDPLIEPVPFSPEQFRGDRTSPLLHEIRKNGVRIH